MNGPPTPLPRCVLNLSGSESLGAAVKLHSPWTGIDAMTAATGLRHTIIGDILNGEVMGRGRTRRPTG